MIARTVTHPLYGIFIAECAEDPVPDNQCATIVCITFVVVTGMVQLVPFGRIEQPAKQARPEGKIAVTGVASRCTDDDGHTNHLVTGAKKGQRDGETQV